MASTLRAGYDKTREVTQLCRRHRSQFWSHSPRFEGVRRGPDQDRNSRSQTALICHERTPTDLESVLGGPPQEFESLILRHLSDQDARFARSRSTHGPVGGSHLASLFGLNDTTSASAGSELDFSRLEGFALLATYGREARLRILQNTGSTRVAVRPFQITFGYLLERYQTALPTIRFARAWRSSGVRFT